MALGTKPSQPYHVTRNQKLELTLKINVARTNEKANVNVKS